MADWLIRVIGKQRKEIDKDLLVQAILARSRQLKQQAAQKQKPRPAAGPQESEGEA